MFQDSLKKLESAFRQLEAEKVDLEKAIDPRRLLTDFDQRRQYTAVQAFRMALEKVKQEAVGLQSLRRKDPDEVALVNRILELVPSLDSRENLQKTIQRLQTLAKQLPSGSGIEQDSGFTLKTPKRMPEEIASEMTADIKELEKCYTYGCYRSAVILCGRLLETALHRKYFEVTQFDILEKNPGIGLGNLVAKLAEKNVVLDPALTNQIHLINQVRIFSVHKKKESFTPSRQQTLAIILYTMDCLNKL